jgi:5'-3' exonuclease
MPNFVFIDGSYFCFYRYYSLITWWKNAYPQEKDVLNNPFENDKFVQKFRTTVQSTLQKIYDFVSLQSEDIVFVGKDCKREDIWRNQFYPLYKANRGSKEDNFMGGPFFKMIYEENLFTDNGVHHILTHPSLEADDCIALAVKQILEKYPDSKIYIFTSDKDYLQLACERIDIYNLAFKKITEQKSCTREATRDLFLKIMTGDPSDNIKSVFPKCGPKTALKYYENTELLEKKLNESETYKQAYELNRLLVDFRFIPIELQLEFFNSCSFPLT